MKGEEVMKSNIEQRMKISKPCRKLKYCPYGILVEQFPLPEIDGENISACSVFGHVCPVFFGGVGVGIVDND